LERTFASNRSGTEGAANDNASSISTRNNGCLDAIAIAFGLVLFWRRFRTLGDQPNDATETVPELPRDALRGIVGHAPQAPSIPTIAR
jgi:hypothetical protein